MARTFYKECVSCMHKYVPNGRKKKTLLSVASERFLIGAVNFTKFEGASKKNEIHNE